MVILLSSPGSRRTRLLAAAVAFVRRTVDVDARSFAVEGDAEEQAGEGRMR